MSAIASASDSLGSVPAITTGASLPPPSRPVQQQVERTSLRVVLGLLVLAGAVVFFQFVPWIALAAWCAALIRPGYERFAKAVRSRGIAAFLVVLLGFVVTVGGMAALVYGLTEDVGHLADELNASRSGRAALRALVAPSGSRGGVHFDAATLLRLMESHASHALTLVDGVSGLALGMFVLFAGVYACLVDGPRALGWLERNTPIANRHIERFAAAFVETGRGLFASVALTGAAQATVATIAYVALDIPRAAVLGVLTFIVSVIPSVGTALVWVPVTIGLWLTGREADALILGALGVVVISSIDNLLRPLFARWGKLDLHPMVVLVSMFGGLAVFGGFGLLLGPLVARWLIEAVRISRQEHILV